MTDEPAFLKTENPAPSFLRRATIGTDLTNPAPPAGLAVTAGRDAAAARKCLENLAPTPRQHVRTYRADRPRRAPAPA
ncbi:MAG TPA: hypothetical protein VEL76_17650, partial [Gemmataceae bacterium]|nr:hypothetical protein [Gemmataceae bacterium]